ncbi:hypothetical protein FALBO_3429 [Fusarium albosuccineum]|uniref:WSC domain-containing protein n=1 Tax=Fusarium albosuccineum TaxID=1237068 RepID=A0A8H4PFZ8_9HYPO|nr:hypothetical protein FALBO_3429 [Fusarium albosuccineum]
MNYVLFILWAALAAALSTKDITPPFDLHGCSSSLSSTAQDVVDIPARKINSLGMCFQYCRGFGKPVGMARADRCYCADTFPHESALLPDGRCDYKCPGYPLVNCGSIQYEAYSVFSTRIQAHVESDSIHDPLPSRPPLSADQLWRKLGETPKKGPCISYGCFGELPRPFSSTKIGLNGPSRCYRECKRKGSTVMVLQGSWCFCTDSYPSEKYRLDDSSCRYSRHGDLSKTCGGLGTLSIWSLNDTHNIDKPSSVVSRPKQQPIESPQLGRLTSQGCFSQLPTKLYPLKGRRHRTNSAENCAKTCQEWGMTVAVTKEFMCYCANNYPPERRLVPDELCRGPCPGDRKQACGGRPGSRYHAFSVYNTGQELDVKHEAEGPPKRRPVQQLPYRQPMANRMTSHGCFNQPPSMMTRRGSGRRSSNTGSSCSGFCKEESKPVAVTRGRECFCSDTYPRKSARVGDESCNTPCPGYPPHACGGDESWSVLHTGSKLSIKTNGEESSDAQSKLSHARPTPKKSAPAQLTPYGCFKDLPRYSSYTTSPHTGDKGDSCTHVCASSGRPVAVRSGGDCWCAGTHPPVSARVDDAKCWYECLKGAHETMCGGMSGGVQVYSVYDTRLKGDANPSQCPHPVLGRIKEGVSWVSEEGGEVIYNVQSGFGALAYRVMAMLHEGMVQLGWVSDEMEEEEVGDL